LRGGTFFLSDPKEAAMRFKTKLILAFSVLLGLAGASIYFILSGYFQREITEEARRREITFVRGLRQGLEPLLANRDARSLNRRLRRIGRDMIQIRYIVILDENGQVIASSSGRRFPRRILRAHPPQRANVTHDQVFHSENGSVRDFVFRSSRWPGTEIHVGMSEEFLRQDIRRARRTIGFVVLAWTGVGILLAWFLSFYLRRNLEDLSYALEKFGEGRLDFRLEEKGDPEVAALIRSYNRMADMLQERAAELLQSNERIEHLNAVLGAIRNVNQRITREKDRDRMLQGVCDDLCETRGFLHAWIALRDGAGEYFAFKQAGLGKDAASCILETLRSSDSTDPWNRALRTGEALTIESPSISCPKYPLPSPNDSQGLMTVRLEYGGEIYGLMTIGLPAKFINSEQERRLFEEVAGDLAYALHTLDLEEKGRRAEEDLREREERLRAVFEAVPNPIVVYDPNGHPQYLNSAFTRVFGWTLEELRGKRIPYVPEDQEAITAEKIREINETGGPVRIDTVRLTRDGKPVEVLLSAASIRGPHGEPDGMVVNLTDMTETKRLEKQFRQAQKMESIGTLAGGIAHDFNNLLMGIQGNITLLSYDIDPESPDFQQARGRIRNIEQLVRSGADLAKQLLGFAKGGKYEVKPTDLNRLVREQTRIFGRTKKEIRIHEKYDENLWMVEADRTQMAQVLMNLYVNAWQAMPGGGNLYVETANMTVEPDSIKAFEVKPGRYVKISITDTGVGMDEETQRRIFEPFFTTKAKGIGTGLGLSAVYGIVKNHGGFITVYSEKGEGSSFHIYLPASGDAATDSLSSPREDAIEKGKEGILLVDDEEMILEVGRGMLEKLGYHVFTAGSGKEALETYQRERERIDLVILDMILPDMPGKKIFEEIRAIYPPVKVLLASGYSLNGQAQEILAGGCLGFIQKPFTMNELSRRLRECLDPSPGR